MRIGVYPLWTGSQVGGIATYDMRLLPALSDIAPEDEFHIFSPARRPLAPAPGNVTYHRLFPRSRWINVPISFPLATAFSPVELVHVTHVPPPFSPRPYVMTLHCVSTFRYPEFYPRLLNVRVNALLRKGLRSARRIICVSKGLRDVAESELKIHPERLTVAYHGVSEVFRPIAKGEAGRRIRQAFGLDRPYLLFVGVLAPRKNLVRLLEAFALFKKEIDSPARLALAGRRWLAGDVDDAVRRLGLDEDVVQLGHVDDAWLPDLYSAAELFVFPSLWESFGMPVIESMACGTPVLTSRGSCLPEIAGDAAVLVDPLSVAGIAEGIAAVMTDPVLAERLRRKGLARAGDFTWEQCARQTLAAYGHALGG